MTDAADTRTKATGIAWRIRRPKPHPIGTTLLGLSLCAAATLPFALLAMGVADLMTNPMAARQASLAGILLGNEHPGVANLVLDLLRTWVFTTPFFAGFILRAAIPLLYPRCRNWLPPMIVRIGIYLAILTCAVLALVLLLSVTGVGAALALVPLLVAAQLRIALRVPALHRSSSELERVLL